MRQIGVRHVWTLTRRKEHITSEKNVINCNEEKTSFYVRHFFNVSFMCSMTLRWKWWTTGQFGGYGWKIVNYCLIGDHFWTEHWSKHSITWGNAPKESISPSRSTDLNFIHKISSDINQIRFRLPRTPQNIHP
jgi:hypothetical protein